jgi:hypothetical protein
MISTSYLIRSDCSRVRTSLTLFRALHLVNPQMLHLVTLGVPFGVPKLCIWVTLSATVSDPERYVWRPQRSIW